MIHPIRRLSGYIVFLCAFLWAATAFAGTAVAAQSQDWLGPALALWLAVVILGCVQGLRRKIVVFSSFQDLYLTFGGATVCIVLPMLFGDSAGTATLTGAVMVVLVGAVLAAIAWATWRANRGVFGFLLALATKLSVSLLLVLKVFELVSPSGRTADDRRQARVGSLLTTLLLVPLVFGLVAKRGGGGEQ